MAVLNQVIEGIAAPSVSVRRRMQAGDGPAEIFLMVLLGYLITMISTGLLSDTFTLAEHDPLGFHLSGFALKVVEFIAIAGSIYWFGQLAGGTGTLQQCFAVVAWHSVVVSFLSPLYASTGGMIEFQPGAPGEPPQMNVTGNQLLLLFVFVGAWFWLLARYVAELHGFKNVWGVLAAVFLGSMALGFIALVLVASLIGG